TLEWVALDIKRECACRGGTGLLDQLYELSKRIPPIVLQTNDWKCRDIACTLLERPILIHLEWNARQHERRGADCSVGERLVRFGHFHNAGRVTRSASV